VTGRARSAPASGAGGAFDAAGGPEGTAKDAEARIDETVREANPRLFWD